MFWKILKLLAILIMFLNMGAGIIGGIWLATRGEWQLIIIGLVLLISFNLFLSILMIPGIAISGLAVILYEKKNILRHMFGYLAQLYINILIVATCVFAFWICSTFYDPKVEGVTYNYIPYLLWSWGMALGPWQYFASKEKNNEFTAITLFSASIFYMLFLGSIFIGHALSGIVIILFLLVQLIVLPIINIYIATKMQQASVAF